VAVAVDKLGLNETILGPEVLNGHIDAMLASSTRSDRGQQMGAFGAAGRLVP
jgi:hypothetical protein